MRIRSIKPEFYSSEDIAALPWETRLLFIGLWSYVDDNGVGRDNEKLILADLFPLEDNPRDTLAIVSRGLQELVSRGLITRYTVGGKPFLSVNTWESHQKIDRPNKARYPRPDAETSVIRDTLATPSRGLRTNVASGTEEQRNRGTGEQGAENNPAPPTADAAEPDPAQQATKDAYERVGKAFKFVAVLSIAKWAIKERDVNPQALSDAFVAIYGMGKPITRQVLGQYLDGMLFQQPRPTGSEARLAAGFERLAMYDQKQQELGA